MMSHNPKAMVRDCGAGASCHNPIPPQRTYTCRCTGGTTLGKAVEGGDAVCTAKDDLPERIDEVEDLVVSVEGNHIDNVLFGVPLPAAAAYMPLAVVIVLLRFLSILCDGARRPPWKLGWAT